MSGSNNSGPSATWYAGWSIRDGRVARGWIITGTNGGRVFRAEGETRAEACQRLYEQARAAGLAEPPAEALRRARGEWMEVGLAFVGAGVGWFVPLLVKRFVPGASATLYDYAKSVLCPLAACLGGGLGFTCGGLWAVVRRRAGR
jgi:hypothetical protein